MSTKFPNPAEINGKAMFTNWSLCLLKGTLGMEETKSFVFTLSHSDAYLSDILKSIELKYQVSRVIVMIRFQN